MNEMTPEEFLALWDALTLGIPYSEGIYTPIEPVYENTFRDDSES